MWRSNKYNKDKKLRRKREKLEKLRDKVHKRQKKKKYIVGWKRRVKVNRAGKKSAIGQDLVELIDLLFLWEYSKDKKEWKTKVWGGTLLKKVSFEVYKILPANLKNLLVQNLDQKGLILEKKDTEYILDPALEKYLYIKVKQHRDTLVFWDHPPDSELEKAEQEFDHDNLWIKTCKIYGGRHFDEEWTLLKKRTLDKISKKELREELKLH